MRAASVTEIQALPQRWLNSGLDFQSRMGRPWLWATLLPSEALIHLGSYSFSGQDANRSNPCGTHTFTIEKWWQWPCSVPGEPEAMAAGKKNKEASGWAGLGLMDSFVLAFFSFPGKAVCSDKR